MMVYLPACLVLRSSKRGNQTVKHARAYVHFSKVQTAFRLLASSSRLCVFYLYNGRAKRAVLFLYQECWARPLFSFPPRTPTFQPHQQKEATYGTMSRDWCQASRADLLSAVVVEDKEKKDDIFHYDFIGLDASGSPFWDPTPPLPYTTDPIQHL